MARRHRHMVGFRILLVVAIPTMYFLCVSLAGLFGTGDRQGTIEAKQSILDPIRTRKLMQIEESIAVGHPRNCNEPSIQEFPSDGFTRSQRKSGFIIIHVVIATYLFLLLAIVCDDFFVPSIQKICDKIEVTKDVAGATFMAAATSSPELFINVVGTFITEGDLGVGTIVGSAVFNILAVPACCGLFASQVLDMDWWPLSRDSMAYGITVLLLIITLHDGRVEWYEALILVITYILYIFAMCFNRRISSCMSSFAKRRKEYQNLSNGNPLLAKNFGDAETASIFELTEDESIFLYETPFVSLEVTLLAEARKVEIVNMTKWPSTMPEKMWWILTWPINLVLLFTIPDCRRKCFKSWYPVTFIMCIVWIASMSYLVAWDITIIGDTLEIPDSVMGLTFLAAGMSVPEAVSSVIVTNQGHGTMGISNSIGSNVFDVLLCLGLPWLVKSVFLPKIPGAHYVQINSEGLVYSSISLFSTLILLYSAFVFNKFKLDRRVGLICLSMYGVFLVFASLVELNVFFPVNLPTCAH